MAATVDSAVRCDARVLRGDSRRKHFQACSFIRLRSRLRSARDTARCPAEAAKPRRGATTRTSSDCCAGHETESRAFVVWTCEGAVKARAVDRRIQRTRQLLHGSLMTLIQEKGFEAVVQQLQTNGCSCTVRQEQQPTARDSHLAKRITV